MSKEKNGPWTILKKEPIYDNAWISLTHQQVITPTGKEGIYGTVHFKENAVGVIPLDSEMNTYLVGQWRFPIKEYFWEIPEGGSPAKEDPIDGARRELLEETGIIAEKWTPLLRIYLCNAIIDQCAYLYVATGLSFREKHPDETEKLDMKKVPFAQLVEMVMNGEITDAMTVAAVLKLDKLIREGLFSI